MTPPGRRFQRSRVTTTGVLASSLKYSCTNRAHNFQAPSSRILDSACAPCEEAGGGVARSAVGSRVPRPSARVGVRRHGREEEGGARTRGFLVGDASRFFHARIPSFVRSLNCAHEGKKTGEVRRMYYGSPQSQQGHGGAMLPEMEVMLSTVTPLAAKAVLSQAACNALKEVRATLQTSVARVFFSPLLPSAQPDRRKRKPINKKNLLKTTISPQRRNDAHPPTLPHRPPSTRTSTHETNPTPRPPLPPSSFPAKKNGSCKNASTRRAAR